MGVFITKTRDQWGEVFYGTDACAVPVLNAAEAARHPHNVARGSFAPTPETPGAFEPSPAPKLSRTPGFLPRPCAIPGRDTRDVLTSHGFTAQEADDLLHSGGAAVAKTDSKL